MTRTVPVWQGLELGHTVTPAGHVQLRASASDPAQADSSVTPMAIISDSCLRRRPLRPLRADSEPQSLRPRQSGSLPPGLPQSSCGLRGGRAASLSAAGCHWGRRQAGRRAQLPAGVTVARSARDPSRSRERTRRGGPSHGTVTVPPARLETTPESTTGVIWPPHRGRHWPPRPGRLPVPGPPPGSRRRPIGPGAHGHNRVDSDRDSESVRRSGARLRERPRRSAESRNSLFRVRKAGVILHRSNSTLITKYQKWMRCVMESRERP